MFAGAGGGAGPVSVPQVPIEHPVAAAGEAVEILGVEVALPLAPGAGTMRDHEDLSALEALILELLLEGDQSVEDVASELDAHMAGVIGTDRARPERGQ
jgi:hypothetical protein